MVYLLNAASPTRWRPKAPERRRAVVLGADLTGMTAAFHLGEHCLLLDRRVTIEDIDDHARVDRHAAHQRSGLLPAERKALFISCSSASEASTGAPGLIHVAPWQPPEFASPPERDEHSFTPSIRILAPLFRGELRLGTQVVRVTPSRHHLECADGSCIVYDALLSSISLSVLAGMAMHELPGTVRSNAALRGWLSEHDIDVADSATRALYGDVDEFAAGKRISGRVSAALDQRFGNDSRARSRAPRVFEPRLVQALATPASP